MERPRGLCYDAGVTTDRPAAGGETSVMIRVAGLGKKFKIYPRPWGRVAEWLTGGRVVRHDEFWALRDVSFDVGRGESIGVIGVNGSGKSTLLKILSGAMYPTVGSFTVGGRVLSLLELGTGVNPDLTGRQNVVQGARMLAFPPEYALAKLPEIESFADLPNGFFDRPVKLYSSGMMVRLVFSMFACFEPDVFVIDEALSVGDVFFQQKCARRLQEMRAAGVTMLFVSHDLKAVEALCDRVLVLHRGKMAHVGDKKTGIRLYYACGGQAARDAAGHDSPPVASEAVDTSDARSFRSAPDEPSPTPAFAPINAEEIAWERPDARNALGGGEVEITGYSFRHSKEGVTRLDPVVERGQWLEVIFRGEARRPARSVNFGLSLYDRLNRLVFAGVDQRGPAAR